MVLGKRLKGAFKAVMMAIKRLSNEELERFQKSGGCPPPCPRPRTTSSLSNVFIPSFILFIRTQL
jgi:hypothetical protein